MTFTNGHALVVGIGTYKNAPNLNVPLTSEDAQEVAAVLRDPRYCAYPDQQVSLLNDTCATRNGFLNALDGLTQLQPTDTFFLFYSGHGEYGEDNHYYLTTHETELVNGKVVSGSGVREQELLEKIKAIPAKRAVLIFNACYSGQVSPESLSPDEELPGQKSLSGQTVAALLGTGEGRVVITACRENQKSYFLKNAEMTIFGQVLSESLRGQGIQNRRGYISVFDLYESVFNRVNGEIQQRFGQFGITQEPELTIQKGVGVMAVALHRGKQSEGELTDQDTSASLSGVVKQVDSAESQAALQQILTGEINIFAGRDLNNVKVAKGDFIEGVKIDARGTQGFINNPKAEVFQHIGDVINATNYAGRDINTTFSSGSSRTTDRISLQDICDQLQQKIQQAQHQKNWNRIEDLQPSLTLLQAAVRAQKSGDTSRMEIKLKSAEQSLESQISTYPDLDNLVSLLQQMR
ncbi:MAG: caspase family protein [Leptolyngbyaceae cyanobacterium MO_188.B28]|nr:caspase family protein [Leptolyngbyaceae cyanobacterium MO_188.B28]